MRIVNDLNGMVHGRKPVVLAAGFFDGLHAGHQKVIRSAIDCAQKTNGQAWVLTFDRHPLRLLHKKSVPPLLTSHRHKMVLLDKLGVHGCIVLPFTRELANLEPDVFAERLQQAIPLLKQIFVGNNWRFGKHAAGTPAHLARFGKKHGFGVSVVRAARRKKEHISSTRIRRAIMRGELEEAKHLLGRPFSVFGTVAHGLALGRKMGFPTANLDYHNEALPPLGIYLVEALLYGPDSELLRSTPRSRWRHMKPVNGILNLGHRPTLRTKQSTKPIMEVHFFDQMGDLYGQDIEVFFTRHLRDEKAFASLAELQGQIARDVDRAYELLALRQCAKR